jgi:hypothetical protein
MVACTQTGADDDDATVDAAGNATDAGPVELAGPCPLDQRLGSFEIAHRELYSAVTGAVADSVNPTTILQPVLDEGDCVLLRKVNPFCDPPCVAGEICSTAGTCIDAPRQKSVGTVVIDGLLIDVAMEPNAVNGYQDTSVPHPPFAPGAAITLTAAGGELQSFTLHGIGIEPIATPATVWTMTAGQPLDIAWTAGAGEREIYVTFNVDQHGNSPVTMHCGLPDTGSATIPASLVDALLQYGVSGFASVNLSRRTTDKANIADGCVDLEVFSHMQPQLQVAGHTPM